MSVSEIPRLGYREMWRTAQNALLEANRRNAELERCAREVAVVARGLVNSPLPLSLSAPDGVSLDPDRPFWVAARDLRATLSVWHDVTGVDGEQDVT